MGIPTYAQATELYHGWTKELIELLAIMVSGQNPDASQWVLNVQFAGVQDIQTNSFIVGVPSGNIADVSAANRLLVDGSGVTQPVSGTVAVSNLPATQPVSGTVAVSNLPATQTVAGSVTATPSFPEEVILEGILRELRKITLLLTIMVGVEVSDLDVGETER